MVRAGPFEKVLELSESLTLDEKETFLDVLRQRTLRDRRKQLARESVKAMSEYRKGRRKVVTVDELMREITR